MKSSEPHQSHLIGDLARIHSTMPASDLRPSERAFVAAMQYLGFGRFEFLRIERSELVLDPWPTTVRDMKFCATVSQRHTANDFLLKQQVVELFAYVRGIEVGEIRVLEVRNGLPFSMEIELRPNEASR